MPCSQHGRTLPLLVEEAENQGALEIPLADEEPTQVPGQNCSGIASQECIITIQYCSHWVDAIASYMYCEGCVVKNIRT